MDAPLSPAPTSAGSPTNPPNGSPQGYPAETGAGETPLVRYERATAPDGWLTSSGWLRLADDLEYGAAVEASDWEPERAVKYTDRARDCRRRAATMRTGAL